MSFHCKAPAGIFLLWISIFGSPIHGFGADHTFLLWPEGKAPGQTRAKGPEKRLENRPRPFYQLTEIAQPSLEIYTPNEDLRTGTMILVIPGGGMQRLAYEHEGLEVAQWLTRQGIVAGVLKYRVPGPALSGAMDAQRAISLMRQHAEKWQGDTDSLGCLGFSAGGEIGLWMSTRQTDRLYTPLDSTDDFSCHLDFAGLIYSGGLLDRRSGELKNDFRDHLGNHMPPVFLAHALADQSQNSLHLALALKQAKVPVECHLFQHGVHGFGVRPSHLPIGQWHHHFINWLEAIGHSDPAYVRAYVTSLEKALKGSKPIPAVDPWNLQASMEEAYMAQTRWIRRHLPPHQMGGFKGAAASAAAQEKMGLEGPLVGVLPLSGATDSSQPLTLSLAKTGPIAIETEIGYRIAVDIHYEILSPEQARESVAAIVPVIELPRQWPSEESTQPLFQTIASNIGSFRYLVGKDISPEELDPDRLEMTLHHQNDLLHQVKGSAAKGGQFSNLMKIMNQLTRNGHTLPAGTLIISGALGGVHTAEPGTYSAQFGDTQTLTFNIQP
jgi:2-keto-4-pentenoate hydratase/acetyl esterase/lipase